MNYELRDMNYGFRNNTIKIIVGAMGKLSCFRNVFQNITSLCFFALTLLSFSLNGQTNPELFENANELYRTNKISEAIEIYEQIEATGNVSSELYYNLGNSYYKLNKIAPSIYNYEKALLLNPSNEDARKNLVFANRMSIDAIEVLPKTVLQKIEENYIQKLTYDEWAILAVVFSILTSLFFLFFHFSYVPSRKRIYFITAIFSVFVLVVSLIFSYKEFKFSKNNIHAIVYAEVIEVKNAPSETSDIVFELHEGTKVAILDSVDTWKKIKLADGKIGWVSKEAVKELY